MLRVRLVIGRSRYVNVTEQADTVSPTGLTTLNVTEHGGHEIGTVGRIFTDAVGVVSEIYRLRCNKHTPTEVKKTDFVTTAVEKSPLLRLD